MEAAMMVAALSALLGSSALAAPDRSPAPADAVKAEAASKSADRLNPKVRVCKTVTYTGSRLGTTKICKARAEWEALADTHEEQTNRIQHNTMPPISR